MISYTEWPQGYFPTLVFSYKDQKTTYDARIEKKHPMLLGFLKCLKARSQFFFCIRNFWP